MLLIFIVCTKEVVSILTKNSLLGQESLLLKGTTQTHDTNRNILLYKHVATTWISNMSRQVSNNAKGIGIKNKRQVLPLLYRRPLMFYNKVLF